MPQSSMRGEKRDRAYPVNDPTPGFSLCKECCTENGEGVERGLLELEKGLEVSSLRQEH